MRLVRDSVAYGAGDAVAKFATLMIFTRVFSPERYGVLAFVLTIVALANAILLMGGDSAFARFWFQAASDEDRRRLSATWIPFVGLAAAVGVLAILPAAGAISHWSFGNDRGAGAIRAALITVPFTLVNRLVGQILRNQFRAVPVVAANVLSMVVSIGFGMYAVHTWHRGIAGFFYGVLVGELSTLPLRLFWCRTSVAGRPAPRLLPGLLAFGLPLVPASMAYWAFATADRVLMARLSTLRELGYYGLANGLVGVLALANSAVGQAWTPHALQIHEERPDSPAVFGRMFTTLLAGMGLLCVAMTAFAGPLVPLIGSTRYLRAAAAVGPLALAIVAYATTHVTALGLSLAHRTRYVATISIQAALVNIALCILLIPRLQMMGAAWATTAAYLYLTVAFAHRSQKLVAVAYEVRRSVLLIGLVVTFTLVAMVIPLSGLPVATSVAVRTAVVVGFVLAAFGARAIDSRELDVIRSVVGRA